MAAPFNRGLVYSDSPCVAEVVQLHQALLRRVKSHWLRRSGVFRFHHRSQSFPKTVSLCKMVALEEGVCLQVAAKRHINALELRSLIHALEYRVHHVKEVSSRVFHLTDSYVVMSIVSK